MKIIKFNLLGNWQDIDKEIIEETIAVMENGGAVIYPLGGFYYLGVNALNEEAIKRLFKIKKRSLSKPMPIMVKNLAMAKKFAFIDQKKEKTANSFWPGAAILVFEKKSNLPKSLAAGKKTIALRMPEGPFSTMLIRKASFPVACVSASFSGEAPLVYSSSVISAFEKAYPRPNLALDAGDLSPSASPKIVDLTANQPKITRAGPISKEELLKMFK